MTAILFQPTGEVRRAEPGEWVMTPRGEFYLWFLATSQAAYPIYTRHEIEATPDVLRALGMEEDDDDETDCPIHGKCGGTDGECSCK